MDTQQRMIVLFWIIIFFFRTLNNNRIRRLMSTHFEDNPLTSRLILNDNEIGYIEDGTFAHIASIGRL